MPTGAAAFSENAGMTSAALDFPASAPPASRPWPSLAQQFAALGEAFSVPVAVSPLPDAVRSDIISHLCDIAIRLKRKITWDPKTETIVNDPQATRMCSRPMRAPWTL